MQTRRISKSRLEIKHRDFTLRPPGMRDMKSLAHHINDPDIARNLLTVPYPYTMEDYRKWFLQMRNISRRKNPDRMVFVIEIDGQAAGMIGLHAIHGHKAEIGYWLGRQFWGRGIMTSVVRELTRFCFAHLGLQRVYALVFPHNKASMRVLEKAGYSFEGILKKNVAKKGRLIDEYLFARVR